MTDRPNAARCWRDVVRTYNAPMPDETRCTACPHLLVRHKGHEGALGPCRAWGCDCAAFVRTDPTPHHACTRD